MASTSNRVQSLLSRTRELVRPTLVETPQFTQEVTIDLPESPDVESALPETSYFIYPDSPNIDFPPQLSLLKNHSKSPLSSPRVLKPPRLSNSLDKSSGGYDTLNATLDDLRQAQAKTCERAFINLMAERQLVDTLRFKLQSAKLQGHQGSGGDGE